MESVPVVVPVLPLPLVVPLPPLPPVVPLLLPVLSRLVVVPLPLKALFNKSESVVSVVLPPDCVLASAAFTINAPPTVVDSVQLHFKVKLNSKATTAKGLENTVKVTASKLSANTTLEALKSDKTMEDSDKISVESSASLRIAKLADKTKGVTLKDGRYDGTKVTAKYGPDSTVKYKITVTNLGSNAATNLLVTEEPSEQLKEISKWGKFSQGSSVKTKNGKTAKVTVDGVTAVIDKLASKDSLELEFDVKLKKDATNAVNLNNSVSISGNYVVNGQEVAMTTTDLMSDKDAISIDKTVKPSGNEKKKNKNGKNGKNGKGTDSSKNGANGKGKTSNGTKTGDNSPIGLLLAIMVVCAGTAVITVLFRRKER